MPLLVLATEARRLADASGVHKASGFRRRCYRRLRFHEGVLGHRQPIPQTFHVGSHLRHLVLHKDEVGGVRIWDLAPLPR